jgi:hypothetical protein
MTPKEKAKELSNKFLQFTPYEFEYDYAKECALIAVDEIIDSIEIGFEDYKALAKNSYWNEVKQEINKL